MKVRNTARGTSKFLKNKKRVMKYVCSAFFIYTHMLEAIENNFHCYVHQSFVRS